MVWLCFRQQKENILKLRRGLANVRFPRKETTWGLQRKEGTRAGLHYQHRKPPMISAGFRDWLVCIPVHMYVLFDVL